MLKQCIARFLNHINAALLDNSSRQLYLFHLLNIILACVSFFMTLINVFTHEYLLMLSTLLFAAACVLNIVLTRRRYPPYMNLSFGIEFIALIAFFFISGVPDGFSALWCCLIPPFSLFVFGIRTGSIYSASAFVMMLFLFWTPFGRSQLLYQYNDTFLLRFPFLYIADLILSLFIEYARMLTHKSMTELNDKYEYLYCHDALTGLYNRYGFFNLVNQAYEQYAVVNSSVLLIDIDDFKKINDRYGHDCGDAVLQHLAALIQETICSDTHACRWGGEELIIFMHCSHDPLVIGEAIRKNVQDSVILFEDQQIHITVSVGICIARNHPENIVSQLISKADDCLYLSKEKGKNCVSHTII